MALATDGAERTRLADADAGRAPWRRWGPYVAARAWGTVREDYSANMRRRGTTCRMITPARRAYRWGEDGIAGMVRRQAAAFASRWRCGMVSRSDSEGADVFGLTGPEGNHGEDVKEYYWLPRQRPRSHAYMERDAATSIRSVRFRIRDLVGENRQRRTATGSANTNCSTPASSRMTATGDVFVDHDREELAPDDIGDPDRARRQSKVPSSATAPPAAHVVVQAMSWSWYRGHPGR